MPSRPLHIIHLLNEGLPDAERERLCRLFYDTVYKDAFPIADEAEDPSVWLPLLRRIPPEPSPILHVALAIADDRRPDEVDARSLLGGIVFEYFRRSKAALVTYICVRADVRKRGIGRFLLDYAVDHLRAHSAGVEVPLFAEAEDPDRQEDGASRDIARRRLPVLRKLGFREIPIRYRQPSLGPGKEPLDTLKFLLYAPNGPATIGVSVVREFMREFYEGLDAGHPDEVRMFGSSAPADIQTLELTEQI